MTGKHIGLVVALAAIAVGYLWVYVDWSSDDIAITYELRPGRRAEPGDVYNVAFGFPVPLEFETVEVTVAPEDAVPANGTVGEATPESAQGEGESDADGESVDDPSPRAVADQASQAGLLMDRLERDEERIARMRERAEQRDRPMRSLRQSYLVYGHRVRGMDREGRPIGLEPGVVYRLRVATVDGQQGQIDFATRVIGE